MSELAHEIVRLVPLAWLMTGVASAALLLDVLTLLLTQRTGRPADEAGGDVAADVDVDVHLDVHLDLARPSRTPLCVSLVAAGGLTLLLLLAALSMHRLRVAMIQTQRGADPGDNAAALSDAIAGQLNLVPFVVALFLIAAIPWVVGFKLALDARVPRRPSRPWPAQALVVLGLLPLALGLWRWSLDLIHDFSSLAELSPNEKVVRLSIAVDRARAALENFGRISLWTTGAMTAIAVGFTLWRDQRSQRSDSPASSCHPDQPRVSRVGLSLAMLLVAAVLFAGARPMRAENRLPWPSPTPSERLLVTEPVTPALDGPDQLERAPVIQIFADKVALDGYVVDVAEELETNLWAARRSYPLTHPGTPFPGKTVVIAGQDLPMVVLARVFARLAAAGYNMPVLTFIHPEIADRPTLGVLRRVRSSGLEIELVAATTPSLARLRDFASYDALARRLIELRHTHQEVTLSLDDD